MNAHDLIRIMEKDIKSAEEQHITGIAVKTFKEYLEVIKEMAEEQKEKDALQTQRDLAFYAAKHASKLENYKARIARGSDGFHAVIAIGQGALKSGAIINGGACVAILAFVGNIITKDASMMPGLSDALLAFGCGLFLAAAASGTTYLAQVAYETKSFRKARRVHCAVIVLVILSYAAFLTGGWQSYRTLHSTGLQRTVSPVQQFSRP